MLVENGIESGVINASGDLFAWGNAPDGKLWKVGVADPAKPEKMAAWFNITNTAVVTSGDYESYIEIEGKRYSHIIDPRTGWPARGIKSVTVICSNAELADALATAIFVMGKDVGLNLVNQLNGIECLIIDDENQFWVSGHLKLNYGRKGEVNYTIGNGG
jgi:thiamine biosynthesis lipoprotein